MNAPDIILSEPGAVALGCAFVPVLFVGYLAGRLHALLRREHDDADYARRPGSNPPPTYAKPPAPPSPPPPRDLRGRRHDDAEARG
jgi:hypothetical protein